MPLQPEQYLLVLPHIVLSCGIVATLLAAAFSRTNRIPFFFSVTTLALALSSIALLPQLPENCTTLFFIDRIAVLTIGLVLFASLSISFIAFPYFEQQGGRSAEFFLLLMLGTLGGLVLASAGHFVSLFLGIELVGIPLAAMAAYLRTREQNIEAGFKYIILAGVSSAFLLFGIALLYAETGSLLFGPTVARIARPAGAGPLVSFGLSLVLGGMGFKLALVPFHFWAPDVYDGAPAPVTIFAATVSKIAVIAALMRIFPPSLIGNDKFLFAFFSALSLGSMVLGTVMAIRQRNIKRLLAYSSIAHNGYLLIAFLARGPLAYSGVLFYLIFSVVTNLASLGVVTVLSDKSSDAAELDDYAGLSWRKPWIAAIFSISILSLLGIPLTAGFIAKFYLVAAGVDSMRLFLVLTLVATTVISAFYYIRIIMIMFYGPAEIRARSLHHAEHRIPLLGTAVITVQAAFILWLGIAPQYVIAIIEKMLL